MEYTFDDLAKKDAGARHSGIPTWIWDVLTTAEIPEPPRRAGEHQPSFSVGAVDRELQTLSCVFPKSGFGLRSGCRINVHTSMSPGSMLGSALQHA